MPPGEWGAESRPDAPRLRPHPSPARGALPPAGGAEARPLPLARVPAGEGAAPGRCAVRGVGGSPPRSRLPREGRPETDGPRAGSPEPARTLTRLRSLGSRPPAGWGPAGRACGGSGAGAGCGRQLRAAQPGRRDPGRPRPPAPLPRSARGASVVGETSLSRAGWRGRSEFCGESGAAAGRGSRRRAPAPAREPTGRTRGSRSRSRLARRCVWGRLGFLARPAPAPRPGRRGRCAGPRCPRRGRGSPPVPFGALSIARAGYEALPETEPLSGK